MMKLNYGKGAEMKEWPQIYTGAYWQREVKAAVAAGKVAPVGIMLYPPRPPRLTYPFYTNLPTLAPNRRLFRVDDLPQFRGPFLALLEERWPKIEEGLQAVADANPGRPLVLLCVDRLDRPGDWCHRQQVAEFLEGKTGRAVVEFSPTTVRLW